MIRRRLFLWALAAGAVAGLASLAGPAGAQAFPSRPITMIVGFAAGGPADTVARIVAEGMRTALGQPVVIENVTGGGGSIGSGRAARAAPDGYTINFGSLTTHVFNGALYTLAYDLIGDFEPVSLVVFQPMLIDGKKAMPANDLQGLVAWLKENPDKATAGHSGVGSAPHAFGVLFQRETGTRFPFVPYRGTGPAMQDLLAGQIDLLMDLAANSVPQARSGTIKAYAVTSKSRLAAAPDIPTVHEAGYPALEFSLWQAIWAPKGTPPDIVARLNGAIGHALADPAARARLADLGQDLPTREQQTPEALGAFQRAEAAKWWPIIKAANMRAE